MDSHTLFSSIYNGHLTRCEPLNHSHLFKIPLKDFFTAFRIHYKKENFNLGILPTDNIPFLPFDSHISTIDPLFLLNKFIQQDFWSKRIKVKRDKLSYKTLLDSQCRYAKRPICIDLPTQIESLDDFQFVTNTLRRQWENSFVFKFKHTNFSKLQKSLHNKWKKHIASYEASLNLQHTVSWSRSQGCNYTLINEYVLSFYKFIDGSFIFPINFSNNSIDFFDLTIKELLDGLLLTPCSF